MASGRTVDATVDGATVRDVVVVGASLGGLRVCESLRDGGYDGRLSLVGAEARRPYDRPPLSKEVLIGTKEPGFAELTRPDEFAALDLELHLGVAATRLDLDGRRVELAGGAVLPYDRVVVATGARPRRLPVDGSDLPGVHLLRTMEDGLALRAAFGAGARVVVIGAGFIGCEVAAAAAARGLDVTMVEFLPTPLYVSLGEDIGAVVEGIHRDHGVKVRTNAAAGRMAGGDRVEEVVLEDGTRLPADVVVVGVGVDPETGWLEDSGLQLDNGVVCDETLHAVGRPDVLAVGDVARWHHPTLGRSVRVEHWTHAAESGSFVAGQILGLSAEEGPPGAGAEGSVRYDPVPYVWSDQHGQRIQILGLPEPGDRVHIVHGGPDAGKMVVLYEGDGRLHAAVSFNHPGRLMRYRPLLVDRAPWEKAEALAAELGP